MMIVLPSGFVPTNSAHTLVVLLHAASSNPNALRSVREAVDEALDNPDILLPTLPAGTFSFADPNEIVQQLLELIDHAWAVRQHCADGQSYTRIVLVGHSLGALLARKIYVCACGQNDDAPFERAILGRDDQPREWAAKVERIILFAGMNRGWTLSEHLSLQKSVFIRLGVLTGDILRFFRRRQPLYFQIRRGAPFITQLRIQWLSMLRPTAVEKKGVGGALVVQLLGSVDDLVAPDDNVDLVTGQNFIYLDVPKSGHGNVVELDDPDWGKGRKDVFIKALKYSYEQLRPEQVVPVDRDLTLPPINTDITDVIFVIHGIRDQGFWTHKIARKVTALGALDKRQFATETSSYGYFPMLPFILPWRRRAKVEWLMDQYTQDLALYPNADFSFMGHSNGTYLLAKAISEYPACHFKRVVFAGSVVRTGYDWNKMIHQGRVRAVLNYVATADWVVALFPKALQTLRLQDLGSAGHDGFASLPLHQQIQYVKGNHSAALREDLWDHIAEFIVHGHVRQLPDLLRSAKRMRIVEIGGMLAPLVWVLLFLFIAVLGLGVWSIVWPEWLKSGALLLYIAAVWSVFTRL